MGLLGQLVFFILSKIPKHYKHIIYIASRIDLVECIVYITLNIIQHHTTYLRNLAKIHAKVILEVCMNYRIFLKLKTTTI